MIAAKAGFDVQKYVDQAAGEMRDSDYGKRCIATVTLRPVVKWGGDREPTTTELRQLHEQAHEECFIANSVKTEIRIEI